MDESERMVDCYSGHTYAQRPRAFRWQDENYDIDAVISEEHTPWGKRFLVKTYQGKLFKLEYIIDQDLWQISPAYLPNNPRRIF